MHAVRTCIVTVEAPILFFCSMYNSLSYWYHVSIFPSTGTANDCDFKTASTYATIYPSISSTFSISKPFTSSITHTFINNTIPSLSVPNLHSYFCLIFILSSNHAILHNHHTCSKWSLPTDDPCI